MSGSSVTRQKGSKGYRFGPAAGASPLFPPRYPDKATAAEALTHIVHQSPEALGQSGTRWKLSTLLAACDWLRTLPGLHQLLDRLDIGWKRAHRHVHSPDVCYVDKLRDVRINLLNIDLERRVFLFQDEFTLHRQPSLASAYEVVGSTQPLAELGWKSNYEWRIAAALNALTGQVTFAQTKVFDVPHLVRPFPSRCQSGPATPGVEVGVSFAQEWSTGPSPKAKQLNLPIQVLQLPTYASWTKPIEKLWRLLSQEVLHLHRLADDWVGLKENLFSFLAEFADRSTQLLRYVGLSDPAKLYRALFLT